MNIEEIKEGLTFDDVLLVPAYSDILPAAPTPRQISRNISLTFALLIGNGHCNELSLAIALAQQGGIGVIHKNLSIELNLKKLIKLNEANR